MCPGGGSDPTSVPPRKGSLSSPARKMGNWSRSRNLGAGKAVTTTSVARILLLISLVFMPNLFPSVTTQAIFGNTCPERCNCGLDSRGRMEMKCGQGRMTEIPTAKLSPSTEVIRIVPPAGQSNHLTIGRFFRQFKKLEEVHIVYSNIPNIGEHSFWGVHSLRVLNLRGNNISQIVESNFKGLVSLEVLNLADNKIDSFVSAAFQSLVKLRELDLSNNKATKLVERLFYNLHMLETLSLSGNQIVELNPDVFRDIWRLKDFRCRRCGLKSVNPLLYALLPDIRVLDIGDNEFKYLNREEFASLIHLRELYLDGNQISAITDDTFRSSRLTLLSLSSNRIVRLDRKAFDNATVAELDLSGNKFQDFDKALWSTLKTNLTKLDLSRNPRLKMHSLQILLSENTLLKGLSLASNEYSDLPLDLFQNLRRLEVLNLSGNHLSDVYTHQFIPLGNLKTLDLAYNKLKGLDSDILSFVDRLYNFREFRLVGNPWACDLCNIPPLLRWIRETPLFRKACINEKDDYCLRCSSPPALLDKPIYSLDEAFLEYCNRNLEPASILFASDPRFGLFLGCGVILIILVVAAILIIVHARYRGQHYYTGEESRPEIGTPPVPPDYDHLAINEGFDNHFFNGNGNKSKMIATIDFDSQLSQYPPDCIPPELTSFRKKSQSRPVSASSPMLMPKQNQSTTYR